MKKIIFVVFVNFCFFSLFGIKKLECFNIQNNVNRVVNNHITSTSLEEDTTSNDYMTSLNNEFGTNKTLNIIKNKNRRCLKLFNGKNLDGWYTFLQGKGKNIDPNNVFSVKNGSIFITGEEFGCITTNDEFENYKLIVEFKWGEKTYFPRVEKARDSGILLHSVGEDGGYGGIWMKSIECQIIEGGTGDIIIVGDGSENFSATTTVMPGILKDSYYYHPDGEVKTFYKGRIDWIERDLKWEDKKGFRGSNDIEKEVGKWNKITCYVKGSNIRIYLNGKLVNQIFNVKPHKGKIQIQSEGAEIYFRKVEVQLL